jgi:hypothetical protein
VVVAHGLISLQSDANCIEQILVTEWLSEEFDCPSLHRASTHGNVAMTGDKNYRDTNVS